MSTPKTPTPAVTTQATSTLYDPFWNNGLHWKNHKETPTPVWSAVAGEEALTQLEALLPQFQGAVPGWKALLLTPVGLNLTTWGQPAQLALLEGLLTELIPPTHPHFVFVLPNAQAVVLFAWPKPEGLVPVVSRLNTVLVGEDNGARSVVQLLDLANPAHSLATWPQAVRTALKLKANHTQAAYTQAQVAKLSAMLNPATVNAALARNGGKLNKKVLVIEDDPSTSLLLTTLLEDMVKCSSAENALDAAQAFELHLPQLVLLDLGLPDIDGLTFLKQLKVALPQAQVVILTANATRENLQAGRALGASGFLAKPFTRAKLQEAMQQHGLIRAPKL